MRIDGPHFKDECGRTLILHGVNLGGSSKVPAGSRGATHVRNGFFDHRTVSFVGRPFPLDEADEHFARLRAWGLTFLRLLVPWEAVEHAGPGIYDQAYLDYLYQIVRKAGEYGLYLCIDPHQDVWSRMSGGDGAPGWTLEAVGMDVSRLSETGAAIVHAIHGDPFPHMIWPTNYGKLAAATMFTLFFGGNDFAPHTQVEREPVQEFLQRHYLDAMKQVAQRLRGLDNVVGYDTLNEPSAGYIGWADLYRSGGMLRLGESPTPFQSMLLGAGFPQEVELWDMGLTGAHVRGHKLLNPTRARVWREGCDCIWHQNGVWDVRSDGTPQLLRPDHFLRVGDHTVDFANDYLRSFLNRYVREMRSVAPEAIIFVEGVPGQGHLSWGLPGDAPNIVHAAHWYDGLTLYTKTFRPWLGVDMATSKLILGRSRVQRAFAQQLAQIKEWSITEMCEAPTLIGEVGIPFDMHDKRAFYNGDFSKQIQAMDASLGALDANLLSYTIWNYTADNTNERGDQWNGEDLSIFSRDQQMNGTDRNSGGRALQAVVRPYACKVAGEPLSMVFDRANRAFEFVFRHDPLVSAPTEVFVPKSQYFDGCVVSVSDGEYEFDPTTQMLAYRHSTQRAMHRIGICGP